MNNAEFSGILVDVTHTSHSRARTGIQRVARALLRAEHAVPICHDPYANAWRPLRRWEEASLADRETKSARRGSRWPLTSKIAGILRGAGTASVKIPTDARSAGLLVPEVFSPEVARALPSLLGAVSGARAAIFHDAIALQLPEFTPAKTVARFPGYLSELLLFDGIAAVSDDSRDSLLGYWQWLGVKNHPPVQTIPLGIDPVGGSPTPEIGNRQSATDDAKILCVGTIEGRKNHLALLDACESLWASGLRFNLRLIGLPRPETAAAALERIRTLQAAGRPLRAEGVATEAELETAYADCTFTVYPSFAEGFGLPVLESVARGKPCICAARGALGESARGGGCLALPEMTAPTLASAIRHLLENPATFAKLATQARERKLKEWSTYATEVVSWLETLKRR